MKSPFTGFSHVISQLCVNATTPTSIQWTAIANIDKDLAVIWICIEYFITEGADRTELMSLTVHQNFKWHKTTLSWRKACIPIAALVKRVRKARLFSGWNGENGLGPRRLQNQFDNLYFKQRERHIKKTYILN